MKSNTRSVVFYCIICSIFVILMIIGIFFDLEISIRFADLEFGQYKSKNIFGVIFEILGELPVYILASFSLVVFLFSVDIKNIFLQRFLKLLFLVFAVLGYSLFFFKGIGYVFKFLNDSDLQFELLFLFACLFLGSVLSFINCYFINKLKKDTLLNLLKFSILTIIIIVVSNLLTHTLKPIFSRERFRSMTYLNDRTFSGYTDFFIINFNRNANALIGPDAFKSFPSGHCTAGASLICLVFLKDVFKFKSTFLLWYIPIIWIVLVAVSRIIMGAHFLTDVVVGSFIPIFLFFLVRYKFRKINKKYH